MLRTTATYSTVCSSADVDWVGIKQLLVAREARDIVPLSAPIITAFHSDPIIFMIGFRE